MGIERRVGNGESVEVVGAKGAAGSRGRGEDRPPGGIGELAAPDSAPLRADLVSRRSTAGGRDHTQVDDLAPAQASEDGRHDHRPVEQPARRVGDDGQQPGHLLGRQSARLGAPPHWTADIEGRVRVDHAHSAGEVVEATDRGQAHRDRRRRRRGAIVGESVGEAVHVEGRRSGRAINTGEEPPDRPAIRLDRPPTAGAPGLLDEEPQRDRLPRLVEGLEPYRRPQEGQGVVHVDMVPHEDVLTSY